MTQRLKVNDEFTVGAQPSESEIDVLAKNGFKTVVNFRTKREDQQLLTPEVEGEKVQATGLQYAHFPVDVEAISPEQVDECREKLSKLPTPIFAHCKTGKRAGAMVMMHLACENDMTGEETVQKAESIGFECDKPELIEFVKNYVDSRNGART